jgi:hypothetical protein
LNTMASLSPMNIARFDLTKLLQFNRVGFLTFVVR